MYVGCMNGICLWMYGKWMMYHEWVMTQWYTGMFMNGIWLTRVDDWVLYEWYMSFNERVIYGWYVGVNEGVVYDNAWGMLMSDLWVISLSNTNPHIIIHHSLIKINV